MHGFAEMPLFFIKRTFWEHRLTSSRVNSPTINALYTLTLQSCVFALTRWVCPKTVYRQIQYYIYSSMFQVKRQCWSINPREHVVVQFVINQTSGRLHLVPSLPFPIILFAVSSVWGKRVNLNPAASMDTILRIEPCLIPSVNLSTLVYTSSSSKNLVSTSIDSNSGWLLKGIMLLFLVEPISCCWLYIYITYI